MNNVVKKLTVRQVASITSLAILALALPIGVYLTEINQDPRRYAQEVPVTPPTTPTPPPKPHPSFSPYPSTFPSPSPSGAPSYLEVISEPSSIINMSPSNNGGYGINAVLINTNTYEIVTDPSQVYFVWGSYGGGFFTLTDSNTCGYGISSNNCTNMHADIEATSTGKAIIYATAFDAQSQTAIGTTYWVLNVTSNAPSPSPSPSPTITNKFDMNFDGKINIVDYTLFIAGFIDNLN